MKLRILLFFVIASSLCNAQTLKDFKTLPKVKWKFNARGVFGSPVADGNVLYVAGVDSTLHAIDIQSGKEKWKHRTFGAMRSTPLVDKDNVYIISEDGLLYNVNKNTGKVTWQFVTPQGTLQERKYDRADYYQSSPAISNGLIYFGMSDYLYAVNESNGTLAWNFKTGNVVHTKPVVANNKVIFGSYDGHLYALNAQQGTLVWKFKSVGHRFFPNGEMMGNPVVSRNLVFAGSRDYNLYAIELNSGYCFWNKQFPKGWALAATVLKDSVLYLGTSDDYVMIAMNPRSGVESWRTPVKYNIFGAMALSQNMGYVGTLMGKLFGIDLKTGAVQWTFEGQGYQNNKKSYFNDADQHLESALAKFGNFDEVVKMYNTLGGVFSTPVVTQDYLIYAGADGIVYCLSR